MAEAESLHRREMESLIVHAGIAEQKGRFAEAKMGQICAAIIAVSALAAGCYAAVNGHDVAGGILGASGVGGIVTTFILGRPSQPETPKPELQKPLSKRAAKRQRNS
jgi:uncharacterized membrane protein